INAISADAELGGQPFHGNDAVAPAYGPYISAYIKVTENVGVGELRDAAAVIDDSTNGVQANKTRIGTAGGCRMRVRPDGGTKNKTGRRVGQAGVTRRAAVQGHRQVS